LRNVSRVLAYKLGGTALLAVPPAVRPLINPRTEPADKGSIARGGPLYDRYCSACHGDNAVGGGATPDLRASAILGTDVYYDIILKGLFKDVGRASFKAAQTLREADARNATMCIASQML